MFTCHRVAVEKRRSGFTLIELLVVIAIIALLAAILFPVFARARENARKSSCANNVKQLLLGVAQYTQDYDETFPVGHNGISGASVYWGQIIMPYIKSTQSFLCPSQSGATYIWATTPAPAGIANPFVTSYAANYQLQRDGGAGGGRSIADVAKASNTIYMSDSGVQATGAAPWITPNPTVKKGTWILQDPTTTGCPGCATSGNQDWAGPHDRHLDSANVGFADGHVKAMKYTTWYFGNTPWLDPARGG